MSVYDLIPSAADLMSLNTSHDNELQATLAKDIAQFLNSSRVYFERGLEVVFYPKQLRDSGYYKKYWIEHHEEMVNNLTQKGYIANYREDSTGLFISLPKAQVEVVEEKAREPINKL